MFLSEHLQLHCIFPDNQMSSDTGDDFYQSDDDFDEDEAMQYIIEQSLIQYKKLKGLNPRLDSLKFGLGYIQENNYCKCQLFSQ